MDKKSANSYVHDHRARLREKYFNDKLADYEKFELFLCGIVPRIDVKPTARLLLNQFKNIHGVLAAPYEKLIEVPGVGANTAIHLKMTCEILLMAHKAKLSSSPYFLDYPAFENFCRLHLANKPVEEFHVLYLDKKRQLIKHHVHSLGTLDASAVYPREILKMALNTNCSSVALMHNHPSGATDFSNEDIKTTEEIRTLLAAASVEFIDHFLVADGVVKSAKALHWLK